MMSESNPPWWRGKRGEWYAASQFALILLLAFGPATVWGYPKWPVGQTLLRFLGIALMVIGLVLGAVALRQLRPSISASGGLKPDGELVTTGPYRLVRHPVYSAQILIAFGFSFAAGGWLTAVYAIALSVVLIFKSLKEERRLLERFSGYQEYKARTHMFVPFIFSL